MDKNTLIEVQNRSAGRVIYRIPEDNIRRPFAPGETKKIPLGELEKLTFQEGGKTLIENYLLLKDPRATEDLSIETEPEYWMNEEQVRDLLENGSTEQFLDALDFAPQGVIDLIKDIAVKIRLNDYNKRQAIKDKTGFDVSAAISNNDYANSDEPAPAPTSKRRVKTTTDEKPKKYTVMTK